MNILSVVTAVVFAGFAVSYGWGMRGYIIGGEKGAMLPGALLGFSIAFFCGDGSAVSLYPFFCAAGALSMFYGGTEPYAQTMCYILHRDDKTSFAYNNVKKGIAGIFLKGALWFGIAGIVLAILPGALSGVYSKYDAVFMCVFIPFVSIIGTRVFNTPFDKEKGVFPHLYFSNGSREEWGGNVLIFAELLICAIARKDMFAVGAGLTGLAAGGIGFTVGLLAYDFNERKHKGRYFFGSWQERKYIDGWKIMEHTFGAIGGGGVMIWFCLNSERFTVLCTNAAVNADGIIKNGTTADTVLAVVVPVLLLLTGLQYLVTYLCKKKSGTEPDIHIFELIERPLFSAVPLIFVFRGYYRAACAVSLLSLLYALCEKCGFEWFSECENRKQITAAYAAVFAVLAGIFFFTFRITPLLLMIVYTFGYTVSVLYKSYRKENRDKRKGSGAGIREFYKSRLTVDVHLVIQCVVLVAVTVILTV